MKNKMEELPDNLMTCPPMSLLMAAQRAGVRYYLWTSDRHHGKAGTLSIWSHRDPRTQPLTEAMRARREEIADYLRLNQSRQPVRIAEAEIQHRCAVLHEPDDVIVGDLTWRDLAPLIDRRVAEMFAVERANDAWEKERQR
jgi:hypothetical protein